MKTEPKTRYNGFSLIEMVVAIGIFAIIAAISYAAMNQFIDTRDALEDRHRSLAKLNLFFAMMERDLRYAQPRSIRDGLGETEAALVAGDDGFLAQGEVLRWTTSNPNTEFVELQSLQRIALRKGDDNLYRVSWRVLDRDFDSVGSSRRILENVSNLSVRFFRYDTDNALLSEEIWLDPERLPAGMEMIITLNDGHEYRRVIEIAHGG